MQSGKKGLIHKKSPRKGSAKSTKNFIKQKETSFWDNFKSKRFYFSIFIAFLISFIVTAILDYLNTLSRIYPIILGGSMIIFLVIGYCIYKVKRRRMYIRELHGIIAQKDSDTIQLKREFTELKNNHETQQSNLVKANNTINTQETMLEEIENERDELKTGNEKLTSQNNQLQIELDEAQNLLAEKNIKYEKLQKDYIDCKSQLEVIQEKNSQLNEEHTELDILVSEGMDIAKNLEQSITNLKMNLQSANQTIRMQKEMVIPKLDFESTMSKKTLGLFKKGFKEIHVISVNNSSLNPANKVNGLVTIIPKAGDTFSKNFNQVIVPPNQKTHLITLQLNPHVECSEITIQLSYTDVLGNLQRKDDTLYYKSQ